MDKRLGTRSSPGHPGLGSSGPKNGRPLSHTEWGVGQEGRKVLRYEMVLVWRLDALDDLKWVYMDVSLLLHSRRTKGPNPTLPLWNLEKDPGGHTVLSRGRGPPVDSTSSLQTDKEQI